MQKPQPEIVCSICGKRVTLREDTCVDENGKVVHTDCHVKQILQDNSSPSRTAAWPTVAKSRGCWKTLFRGISPAKFARKWLKWSFSADA